jgi:hypothetical protein
MFATVRVELLLEVSTELTLADDADEPPAADEADRPAAMADSDAAPSNAAAARRGRRSVMRVPSW